MVTIVLVANVPLLASGQSPHQNAFFNCHRLQPLCIFKSLRVEEVKRVVAISICYWIGVGEQHFLGVEARKNLNFILGRTDRGRKDGVKISSLPPRGAARPIQPKATPILATKSAVVTHQYAKPLGTLQLCTKLRLLNS